MFTVLKIALMSSGIFSWIFLMWIVVLEIRMRFYLKTHGTDWPEPVFNEPRPETHSGSVVVVVLFSRLRIAARELRKNIEMARQGDGLISLEERFILEEINKVMDEVGLEVVSKEQLSCQSSVP